MPAPAPRVAALPPVNDDPAQLLGLDRDGVSALLGTPDLIRREAPAEIWQYVGGNCVFDVVLYERGASYAVSYLEARDATAGVQPAQSCLNQLLRARQTAPVGSALLTSAVAVRDGFLPAALLLARLAFGRCQPEKRA